MTAIELTEWLTAHGWNVAMLSDTELLAGHAGRGDRRYLQQTLSGKLVGDERSFWRVERVKRTRKSEATTGLTGPSSRSPGAVTPHVGEE